MIFQFVSYPKNTLESQNQRLMDMFSFDKILIFYTIFEKL